MPVSDQRDALVGRVALMLGVTCVAVVAATVLVFALPVLRERLGGRALSVAYTEGDLIDLDPVTYRSAASTVFLFSRFSCGACQASKPIMAAIVADLRNRPDTKVVLVTGDAVPEEERLFAFELGIDSSQIHQTDLRRLRLRQVPTMVLVDKTGKILLAQEGRLTESNRSDIVRISSALLGRQP